MADYFNVARITYNANGWQKPSGPNHKSSHRNDERTAFESQYDFGFEEWLFDESHRVGDYQYGYIEKIESKHQGKPLLLYTLKYNANRKGPAERLLAAIICKWEHMSNWSEKPSKELLTTWCNQMKQDLYVLNGMTNIENSIEQIDEHMDYPNTSKPLFNIRFKIDDRFVLNRNVNASELTRNNRFNVQKKSWSELPEIIRAVYTSLCQCNK